MTNTPSQALVDVERREVIAQIIARAYGGSLYPGLGAPGDYPTDDPDYRAADAILALDATPSLQTDGERLDDQSSMALTMLAPWLRHNGWHTSADAVDAALAVLTPSGVEGETVPDLDARASEYAAEYVMSTEGADYEPSSFERSLIEDAPHGFLAETNVQPSTTGETVPGDEVRVCDGKEQDAFEAWAEANRYDMETHPLHWLFLNERTAAARNGWKAGLTHAVERLAASPKQAPVDQGEVDWKKPIEAFHQDGRTVAMKVAQLNAGAYADNDHWIVTANAQRFPGAPGSHAHEWVRKDGFLPSQPGWRVRNASPVDGEER